MIRAGALCAILLLAACGAEKAPEPAPKPKPTRAVPRTLIPANFDPATLGPRVEGMDVTDAAIGAKKDPLAKLSAYVACAKSVAACDPAQLPEGTVYTYVLTITPTPVPVAPSPTPSASDGAEATSTPDDFAQPETATELVRTLRAVPQFKGAVGFALAEAAAALGDEDALAVTLDTNRLIWRVTRGNGWQADMPITLWWQSTRAPAKPAPAYRLEYGGKSLDIAAPFPMADKAVERAGAR